jgi:hypothetical protein
MVRYGISILLLFVGFTAFAQFPRFRLIQLQQADTLGQFIQADTNKNAYWSSDLRVQDSIFYVFGNPYTVDSTRMNDAGDSILYYSQGVNIGGDVLPTGLIDSTRLVNDTLNYYQNGVVIGFDVIATVIDSTRLSNDTLIYYQNGNVLGFDIVDIDTTNEIQTITRYEITNDSLYIALSKDGTYGVDLSPYLDNTDTSGFNRRFQIINDTLYIEDDDGTLFVDLLPYLDNTIQTLSIVNDTLYISDGNGVTLSPYLDNTDEQTLSFSNDTLYISNGNSVYIADNTDTSGFNRAFTFINDTLSITDDNGTLSVILPVNTDTSGFNRNFYLSNDSLYIQDDNSSFVVDLSTYALDTSGYNSSFEILNDTLFIEDGSDRRFVSLSQYLDNTDTSGYNRDFYISNDTIYLIDDNSTKTLIIPNTNTDTSGYNQSFTLQDSILLLQDGNSTLQVDIKEVYDNTDTSGYNSQLSLVDNVLYLTDGQSTLSVDISSLSDNTDTSGINRSFYISNDSLYINDDESVFSVLLTPYLDNTDTSGILTAFYISNDSIYITDGNVSARADLSPYLDNTDTSGYNQSLDLVNNFLILEDGTTILQEDLSQFLDNTDTSGYNTRFYVSGSRIYLEDGNGQLFVANTDYDNQQLSLSSDTLYLSRGGYVVLPLGTINTDDQVISISNDTIFLEDGGFVKLPPNIDTSGINKQFFILNNTLYINDAESSFSVDLSPYIDNTDTSGFNRSFLLSNDTLYITDDNNTLTVLLSEYTNTDTSGYNSNFYIANDSLFITDGSNTFSVDLSVYTTDTSGFNRTFVLGDSMLYLLDDNSLLSVDLHPVYDNTDDQQLTKSNDTIYLENGGFVTLLDDDPTNELQTLSVVHDTIYQVISELESIPIERYTIYLTNGDSVIVLDKFYDPDYDITNELQQLSISNDTIFISKDSSFIDLTPYTTDLIGYNREFYIQDTFLYIRDDSATFNVDLRPFYDNTDIQQLSQSGDTIFLTNGGYVLSDNSNTNELQVLSSTRVQDSIVNHLGLLTGSYKYTIYLTNGDSVILHDTYNDADPSPYNELQDLTLNGNTLSLTFSNVNIDLSPYLDNTDDQQLTKSNDTIYLEDGGNVQLLDDDPTNELQTLSIVNDTLYLTNGGSAALPLSNIDSTRLNNTGDTLIYYFNDSIVRKDPINTIIDVVSGCVGGLTASTDVYALFDMSGSVNESNVEHIITVLSNWHSQYKIDNPTYTGSLYTIPVLDQATGSTNPTEQWLDFLYKIRNNLISVETGNAVIDSIVMLPPWLDGSGGTFVAPDEILLIGFVNESDPYYHSSISLFETNEPTDTFNADLNRFLTEYSQMTYFKGVLYPINQDAAIEDAFILHAIAALEATTLTDEQLQEAFGGLYEEGVFDIINTVNNYSIPLKDYGWSGILDKTNPASVSFTDSSFNSEINQILSENDINFVPVLEDYSNNIITLRSIGSRTLDITVDSSGCIRVEYIRGDIQVYGDSITILGDGGMAQPLRVDTNLIVTTKALNDSLANIPAFVDSTRLSDDAVRLEYFQNGILIGFDTLTRGDGLFQELFLGNGIDSILSITSVNGLLPNDKNDILVYRNGIFLGSDHILGLSNTSLALSFTPEQGDIIMITWFLADVYTEITAGIDSVFTGMYLLGNGLQTNPLTIDTMYTASKAYVDSQIAASGTGTITGVNEFDEPTTNYGLNGGASTGKVNLLVDTSVIADKQWVIDNYSLLDSVIGDYGLTGSGDVGNVSLDVDTSIIVSKEYLSSLNYTSGNDEITIQGDVTEVTATQLFNLNVIRSTNLRGGNTGAIPYQQSNNNTVFLTLPDNATNISEYVISDGSDRPYWLAINQLSVLEATKLTTGRTINGITFDGTQDITISSTTPQTLTKGNYLTGSNFNGSSATTWAVDATSTNTANKVVVRDASGNFAANQITATLLGTASQVSNSLTPGEYILGSAYNGSVARTFNLDTTNLRTWIESVSGSVNSENLTITTAGGATSPATYNGSTPITISYNTVGAPSTSGTNASGSWNINSATTTKLLNARSIQVTGNAIQSSTATNFDGTSNIQLPVNELNATYLTTGTVPIDRLSGTYNINISGTVSSVDWNSIINTPTSLSGYGITDAVKTSDNQTINGTKNFTSNIIGNLTGTADIANKVKSNLYTGNGGYYLTYVNSSATDNKDLYNHNTYFSIAPSLGRIVLGSIHLGLSGARVFLNPPSADELTINFPEKGSNYTADFVVTEVNQTINGVKTFTEDLIVGSYRFDASQTPTDNYVLTYDASDQKIRLEPSATVGGGTTTQSITFNNSGSGASSPVSFDGSVARTISYNTIGAASTTGANASGTWPINISGNAATATSATSATNANYASVAGSTNNVNVVNADGSPRIALVDGTGTQDIEISDDLYFNGFLSSPGFISRSEYRILKYGGSAVITHNYPEYSSLQFNLPMFTTSYVYPDVTADFIVSEGDQTINGTKTFTSAISGNITGNAATSTVSTNINAVQTAGSTTLYPVFLTGQGDQKPYIDGVNFYYTVSTGQLQLGNYTLNTEQTVNNLNDGQVLTYNNGSIQLEPISASGDITGVTAGNGLTDGGTSGDVTLNVGAGTGIDVAADAVSVDVSDFMSNGANNRIVTATGTDAMNAESGLTWDGDSLQLNGDMRVNNEATFTLYNTYYNSPTSQGGQIELENDNGKVYLDYNGNLVFTGDLYKGTQQVDLFPPDTILVNVSLNKMSAGEMSVYALPASYVGCEIDNLYYSFLLDTFNGNIDSYLIIASTGIKYSITSKPLTVGGSNDYVYDSDNVNRTINSNELILGVDYSATAGSIKSGSVTFEIICN